MDGLPQKLKKDAIAEALIEVRYSCPDSAAVPELVVGRLAGFADWRSFDKVRLPFADIPPAIRAADPNLRYQPVLELHSTTESRAAKIGPNVLSYHALAPYPGWTQFSAEIDKVIDFLFAELPGFEATRIGFRYINLLTKPAHLIESVDALEYSVTLGGEKLEGAQNLNYKRRVGDDHFILVRVASPDFVSSPERREMNALVDVDVFTPDEFKTSDIAKAKKWVADAHGFEKKEFFKLIPPRILDQLIEA